MSATNGMRFRPTAAVPFALSIVSFTLVLLLVLSGTRPDLVPDGYLLSFNTTDVGQNLVEFNPATATAVAARNVVNLRSRQNSNSTSSTQQSLHSTSQSLNATSSTSQGLNTTAASSGPSSAPSLSIPTTAAAAPPSTSIGGIQLNVAVLGALFQVLLNSLASGVGAQLQSIVTLGVATTKQQAGVTQFYTMHLNNMCQGSVTNGTDAANPMNLTRCITYNNASSSIQNFTSSVPSSAIVSATNITVPFLTKVPGIGQSTKQMIDTASGFILFFFIINLIGSAASIILSAAAIFMPGNSKIPSAAAAITTMSTQILQSATITSTIIAVSLSSSINKFSDTLGLRATIGSKFLAFIWIGYIAAQIANGYWVTVWFVEYRKRSYKARERTPMEIGDYKGIKREVLSDIRLQKVDNEYAGDTEALWEKPQSDGLRFRRQTNYNEL